MKLALKSSKSMDKYDNESARLEEGTYVERQEKGELTLLSVRLRLSRLRQNGLTWHTHPSNGHVQLNSVLVRCTGSDRRRYVSAQHEGNKAACAHGDRDG